jgi:hypothetical protein
MSSFVFSVWDNTRIILHVFAMKVADAFGRAKYSSRNLLPIYAVVGILDISDILYTVNLLKSFQWCHHAEIDLNLCHGSGRKKLVNQPFCCIIVGHFPGQPAASFSCRTVTMRHSMPYRSASRLKRRGLPLLLSARQPHCGGQTLCNRLEMSN